MKTEKNYNYRIEAYRNKSDYENGKKPLPIATSSIWYAIPEQRAIDITIGIATGLRIKYTNPFVALYRIDGEKETLIRKQQ